MNYSICTLRFGLGAKGGLSLARALKMHNTSGLSQARHLHHDK